MKKITLLLILITATALTKISAQEATSTTEKHGNTLNAGIGIGYYGYIHNNVPVFHANFEFDVVKNLTLAPFITYYSYQNNYYWGNKNYPYRNYYHRTTVMPIGVKATYYFDEILKANSKWDFYLAGSIGFAIRKTTWENGYYGETTVSHGTSGLYLDGHIGAEYHFNNKLGMFLDLSSGFSTLGLAVHL
ncbi:MAG: hypothetical protein Q7W45_09670 [Bacteroidota bacterium]|nr:hypothetical protein [Bacteroidota bacterium]MDP3144052.1 hypothetical protein [Bacteroidota bacterium]MDP3557452.1 hypothetical protein [Bacteroidota bacterium]